jgi:hypothetical protein
MSVNNQLERDTAARENLPGIEERVRCRLTGRVGDFQLIVRDQGLVLRGHAHTYYAKQLAQHAVMDATNFPIRANEIEVR